MSWSKDNVNELHPVYQKKLGNDTRSLTYVLQDAAKHFTSYSYSCFLDQGFDFDYAVLELDVKGKIKSHTLFLSASTCCQHVALLHLHCLYPTTHEILSANYILCTDYSKSQCGFFVEIFKQSTQLVTSLCMIIPVRLLIFHGVASCKILGRG